MFGFIKRGFIYFLRTWITCLKASFHKTNAMRTLFALQMSSGLLTISAFSYALDVPAFIVKWELTSRKSSIWKWTNGRIASWSECRTLEICVQRWISRNEYLRVIGDPLNMIHSKYITNISYCNNVYCIMSLFSNNSKLHYG